MPSWQLPQYPKGPAVWQVESRQELEEVVSLLLSEPIQRHSQGHAAAQGAARIGDGMLTIAWEVLNIMVLDPALTGLKTNSIVHAPAREQTLNRSSTLDGQDGDDEDEDADDDADANDEVDDDNRSDHVPSVAASSASMPGAASDIGDQ